MKEEVKKYMPEYVSLYYVDYRDDLRSHFKLMQECIDNNSLCPLSEAIFDWWDFPEEAYLKDIKNAMRKDGVEYLFEEHYDEIVDYLTSHDNSDPVKDLLNNTGCFSCYYDLGIECDCGWHKAFMSTPWQNESPESCAYKIRRKLGIKKGTPEADKILNICQNATYGGSVRIYFKCDLRSLILESTKEKTDFQQIKFKGGVALAVYNPIEGAGDFDYINIDCSFPFLRDNLSISNTEKYSLEYCFGMCSDWLNQTDEPQLSIEPIKTKCTINKSKASDLRKREAELDAKFKAGSCTYGDMDMKRHRGVYYRNDFPCGSCCPHCGTFWID